MHMIRHKNPGDQFKFEFSTRLLDCMKYRMAKTIISQKRNPAMHRKCYKP